MPHPNDPSLRSFIAVDPASDFPIQNLPYGMFSKDGLAPRVGVAIGEYVLGIVEPGAGEPLCTRHPAVSEDLVVAIVRADAEVAPDRGPEPFQVGDGPLP